MKKADFLLTLLGSLLQEKKTRLSIDRAKDLFPKARSSYFRNMKEVLEFTMPGGQPLFRRFTEDEIEFISLNKSFIKEYIPEGEDNIFNLQALMKAGRLMDNSLMKTVLSDIKDFYQINGKAKEINEKFYLLSHLDSLSEDEIYSDLLASLLNNKMINFNYSEKSYEGYSPLSICQHRDALYLLAFKGTFSKDNIKTFKLSRFESVEITDSVFKYPGKWNVENYFENSSGIISGEKNVACIRVYRESRRLIKEKSYFNKTLIENNDLYDEYELVFSSSDEFLGQLFVYAQDIEIVSPTDLKEDFINKAKQALSVNDDEVAS
ncbi:hypothetical protein A9Q84_14645 [Halobacteriovorax marinus]|uniref:Uncharacterized protein n=1 Tax=Halobacteriovorax marinus TaxID=97084 RepID=A0A1Y5F4Z7_9BACT|nr:hypothetical protein A9Q84_14645 [Halobacteriovorax marinus]